MSYDVRPQTNCCLIPPGTEQLSPLLITSAIQRLLKPKHYAYVCSSGSKGYHAFKEMLQNGLRGSILLLESYDLITTPTTPTTPSFNDNMINTTHNLYSRIRECPRRGLGIYDLPTPVSLITNLHELPPTLFWGCINLVFLDLSQLSPQIKKLPEGFLSQCAELETLHLPDHLTSLPPYFLSGCARLKTLDMGHLSQLKVIPCYFLAGCSALETLHLPPHLSTIPQYFLSRCRALKSLDLSPLSSLAMGGSLPSYFLSKCVSLTALDLNPLSYVEVLPEAFLQGCCGLTSLNLRPLSNLRELPPDFLSGCSGLTALDLAPLTHLLTPTALADGSFLSGCTELRKITLSPHHSNVITHIRGLLPMDCVIEIAAA